MAYNQAQLREASRSVYRAQEVIMAGIAGDSNFQVVWQPPGKPACMDPASRRVYLPMIDVEDDEQVTNLRAFADHEIGHDKRKSQANDFRLDDPQLRYLYGFVDDVRVNYTFGTHRLPGSWSNIVDTHRRNASKADHSQSSEETKALWDAFLHLHTITSELSTQTKLVADITAIMKRVANPTASHNDSIMACEAIQALLQEWQNDQEQRGESGESNDSDDKPESEDGSDDEGSDSDTDESGDDEGSESGDSSNGEGDEREGNGDTTKSDGNGNPQDAPPSDPYADNDDGDASESSGRGGNSAGKGEGYENDKSVENALADTLTESTRNNKVPDNILGNMHQIQPLQISGEDEVTKVEITPNLGRLRRHLSRALRSHGALYSDSNKGRLNSRKLAKIALGNTRVFRHTARRVKVNTSVSILLDCSSSMSWGKQQLAGSVCAALAAACNDVGARTELIAYGSSHANVWSFNDRMNEARIKIDTARGAQSYGGGTSPLEPVQTAIEHLSKESTERKLILLITDGAFDSPDGFNIAREMRDAVGIDIAGVGIFGLYDLVSACGRDRCVEVSNEDEFGDAMFREVARIMGIDKAVREIDTGAD